MEVMGRCCSYPLEFKGRKRRKEEEEEEEKDEEEEERKETTGSKAQTKIK